MLKDRRVLVEKEVNKQKKLCASLYLDGMWNKSKYNKPEYDAELEKLTNMMTELALVIDMIESGHE